MITIQRARRPSAKLLPTLSEGFRRNDSVLFQIRQRFWFKFKNLYLFLFSLDLNAGMIYDVKMTEPSNSTSDSMRRILL